MDKYLVASMVGFIAAELMHLTDRRALIIAIGIAAGTVLQIIRGW